MVTGSVRLLSAAGISVSLLWAPGAFGQEAGGEEPVAEPATTEPGETVDTGTGAAVTGDAATDAAMLKETQDEHSPVEHKGQSYNFIGWRYRGIIVPQFMMKLFGADGGTTVYVHSTGPEYAIRKDNFEYVLSLWWAGYFMDPTTFKGKKDGPDAWELIESDIHMIAFTADFLWSHMFNPQFGLNYGIGAGLGVPFGPLKRTELYPGAGSSSDPDTWTECTDADAAAAGQQGGFCEEGPKKEPSWANGGSKPIVFPWLAFQFGFRIKPHRNFVARIDTGFGTSGFFVGIGADYGL
jgi:hypothetical protein